MSFSGSGYVHYHVPSVELYDVIDIRLSFRLDAKVDNGEMLSVFGVSDFCIIDVSKLLKIVLNTFQKIVFNLVIAFIQPEL